VETNKYEEVGQDGEWAIWFGWRYAHCWVGDPWVRRFHIFGYVLQTPTSTLRHFLTLTPTLTRCPLRNVPMGQLRKVKEPKELPDGHFEAPALRHPKRPPPSPPPKPPPPKRRAMPASAAIPAQGPLSEYEEQRLRNIARNKAKLESLGCD